MNRDIKYLYEMLTEQEQVVLKAHFYRSPKMISYLNVLEEYGLVRTPKAVSTIYQEEEEKGEIENNVLINRFYKLRGKLHLYLLKLSRGIEESMTEEEQELFFLRRLILKNEFAYALEKLKVLEQKCWEDNLFEILPQVINLLQTALHGAEPNNLEGLKIYMDKATLVSELATELQRFKNYIINFRLNYDVDRDEIGLEAVYKKSMTQISRRVKGMKEYPRFSLLYHYIAFCIGSQIGERTAAINNSLARHLNKLKKLLERYPSMPLDNYVPHHRVFNLDFLAFQEALYWYYRGDVAKSYQYLRKSKQIREEHPKLYFKNFPGTLHNAVLCCLAAQEYQGGLFYLELIKEQQIMNDAVYADIPYFVYEGIIYSNGYPLLKHADPANLIQQLKYFLNKQTTADYIWVYTVIGTFSLLYHDLATSRHYLMTSELETFYQECGIKISSREVLELVEVDDKKGLIQLINHINTLKKELGQGRLLEHYEDVQKVAKNFI
ncbi:MAG: hypothetical protein ACRBFS_19035 [Aureispira sp.]